MDEGPRQFALDALVGILLNDAQKSPVPYGKRGGSVARESYPDSLADWLSQTAQHPSMYSHLQTPAVITPGFDVGENSSAGPGRAVGALNNRRLRWHQ